MGETLTEPSVVESLKVIQSNTAANLVFSLPLNTIGLFDVANANLPAGWSHMTSMDGNYLRGENATCSSSCGASTHSHTRPLGTGNITSGAGTTALAVNGLTNLNPAADSTHTHSITSISTTADAATNTPAFAKVNFAKNTVNNSALPNGLMAFFDSGSLPVGWTNAITANASYANKLITGSTDPTTTQFGGSDTHCHTDASAGACQETFTSSVPSIAVSNTAVANGLVGTSTHTHNVIFDVSTSNSIPSYTTLYLAKIKTISITGTVYSDEGVTTLGTQSVRVAIAGSGFRDAVGAANGTYSASVPDPGSGGIFTAWIKSGGGNLGSTVVRSNGSDISGLDIYQNRLIVRHQDAGPITNADIGQCDKLSGSVCSNTDLHYSVTSGNLTVDNDWRLYIDANSTFFLRNKVAELSVAQYYHRLADGSLIRL